MNDLVAWLTKASRWLDDLALPLAATTGLLCWLAVLALLWVCALS